MTAASDPRVHLLLMCLETAVPMWISQFSTYTEDGRHAELAALDAHGKDHLPGYECRSLADIIASHGDAVLTGGFRGDCAPAFNALAKALGLAAFAHGGVTFCGVHWCVGSGHLGVPHAGGMCVEELRRKPVMS